MANDKPVYVSVIRITNVLGIASAEIRPGIITLIEGQNGAGKTSILEAIRVLGGGNDATLLRNGAESGEVVLELSNGVEITKLIGPEKSRLIVDHPELGMVSRGQTYLDKIVNEFALNPVDFLTAKPDKRTALLLEAIPMTLTPADLAPVAKLLTIKPNLSQHALKVLGAVSKDIFEQRTGVNRSLKDKRASVEQMSKSLPVAPVDATNWKDKLQRLRQEYAIHQQNVLTASAEIRSTYEMETAAVRRAAGKQDNAINEEIGNRIDQLHAEIARLIEERANKRQEIQQQLSIDLHRIARQQSEELDNVTSKAQSQTNELSRAIAEAEARTDEDVRASTLRETIEEMGSSVTILSEDADRLTAGLDSLEDLRQSLLQHLPIANLAIDDGEIFIDGIPFDRINESRKVRLAIEIAKLNLGQLRLLIVDGLERLDPKNFAAFAEEIRSGNHDVQFVLARVTGTDLQIRTEGEVA